MKEQVSEVQEIKTILQASRYRTYHWIIESRPSFRSQLLQETTGDSVNILLAVAVYRLKRAMRVILQLFKIIIEKPGINDFSIINTFRGSTLWNSPLLYKNLL